GGKRCINGSNIGAPCAINSECPGGACDNPGEPPAPNACIDDTSTMLDGQLCQPNGGNEGICPEGPVDGRCSIESFRSCFDDTACKRPVDGGSCVACAAGQTCNVGFRECFTDNGVIGGTVDVSGSPGIPCGDTGKPEVGTFFCIAPVTAGAVNIAG